MAWPEAITKEQRKISRSVWLTWWTRLGNYSNTGDRGYRYKNDLKIYEPALEITRVTSLITVFMKGHTAELHKKYNSA